MKTKVPALLLVTFFSLTGCNKSIIDNYDNMKINYKTELVYKDESTYVEFQVNGLKFNVLGHTAMKDEFGIIKRKGYGGS